MGVPWIDTSAEDLVGQATCIVRCRLANAKKETKTKTKEKRRNETKCSEELKLDVRK